MRRALCLIIICLSALMASPALADGQQQSFWQSLSPEWGGHIRGQAIYSHADDDSYFAPVGAGDLYDGVFDFRLKNKVYFGQWGEFETHYEATLNGGDTRRKLLELSRIQPGLAAAGALQTVRPINDDRRLFDLTKVLSDDDSYVLYHRLDRLVLDIFPDWGTIRLGRQALTWGHGLLFNPMDLFNPFSPTDFQRDYKVGDDMAFVQFDVGSLGSMQALALPRRNPANSDVEWQQSALAVKLHHAWGDMGVDFMLAKNYQDNVAAVGAVGYVGQAAWRCDITYTQMDDDYSDGGYLSFIANIDYSWVWAGKNWYGWLEFYFNGLGRDDPEQAIGDPAIVERLDQGTLFVMGRAYIDAQLKYELHPLLTLYAITMVNLHDGSLLLQPRAVWSATQNTEVQLGGNAYLGGDGTEYGGFTLPGTDLKSTAPDQVFLWVTYYF